MRWLLDKTDLGTLGHLLILGGIGAVAVASATHQTGGPLLTSEATKHVLALLIGVVVYWLVQRRDYLIWADRWSLYYVGGLVVLIAVYALARPIAGARAWFELGPLRFQPSEVMKVITALACAAFLSRVAGKLSLARLAQLGLLVLAPMLLIVIEPDMGTAVTFVPLFLGVAWVAGLRPRVLVLLVVCAGLCAPIGWFYVLKPYQKERILTVLDPSRDPSGIGYQVQQSRIAVGSGEAIGKGLFRGTQVHLDYLPARQTDFVLAVVGEETGFIGVLVVLSIYMSLVFRALETAATARDHLGAFLAAGIAAIWAGQIFINCGMITGILPTIGVPLPLLSYGGSSVIATFLAFGLVGSVRAGRIVNA